MDFGNQSFASLPVLTISYVQYYLSPKQNNISVNNKKRLSSFRCFPIVSQRCLKHCLWHFCTLLHNGCDDIWFWTILKLWTSDVAAAVSPHVKLIHCDFDFPLRNVCTTIFRVKRSKHHKCRSHICSQLRYLLANLQHTYPFPFCSHLDLCSVLCFYSFVGHSAQALLITVVCVFRTCLKCLF